MKTSKFLSVLALSLAGAMGGHVDAAATASGPKADTLTPKGGGPALKVVRVRPSHVLGTVNGVKVSLADLTGQKSDPADSEQVISLDEYDALLDRAIEREAVAQAALAQGVDLNSQQRKQLDELRARLSQSDPNVIKELTRTPETIEFQLRDIKGLMLGNNLAAQAGVPGGEVGPDDVEKHYQKNKGRYGELPTDEKERNAAWQKIDKDIRQELAAQIQSEHQKQLRQFLDGLKAQARIAKARLQ